MLMQLEQFIELPVVERVAKSYDIFIYDPTSEEVDIKAEKLIREIKPDLGMFSLLILKLFIIIIVIF